MTKNLSTKEQGDAAEDEALRYLEAQGLRLLVRNYRTPGRGGGEIDLIMQAPEPSGKEPTTVFVKSARAVLHRTVEQPPASAAPNNSASFWRRVII